MRRLGRAHQAHLTKRSKLSTARAVLSLLAPFLVAVFCLGAPPALLADETDDANMDKVMAPVALYPDALLAQVLTAATSPDQVTAFHKWLGEQTATGSDLQQAAMDADFDAAFASLALFPDVVKELSENLDWTKEIGTAYLSDKDAVAASIQRLRAQAKEQGNLESGEEQTVTVTNEGGNQTIVIEPTNPQVVYVPQYPTTVYTEPAPAGGMLFGFALGVAIGAAMHNDYYGWGAWGYGWHGGGVHYHHTTWVVPVHGHYGYARPVHGYHAHGNVVAPRRTNVNINVDNSHTNIGNKVNVGDGDRGNGNRGDGNRHDAGRGDAGDRPTAGTADRPTAGTGDRGGAKDRAGSADKASNRGSDRAHSASASARGRASQSSSTRAGGTTRSSGGSSGALGGYGSGSSTRAASSRGHASAGGGGGRRR